MSGCIVRLCNICTFSRASKKTQTKCFSSIPLIFFFPQNIISKMKYRVCQGSWPSWCEKCGPAKWKKYTGWRMHVRAMGHFFVSLNGSDKALLWLWKVKKNYQFNIFAYEGYDLWHTRYKKIVFLFSMKSLFRFDHPWQLLLFARPIGLFRDKNCKVRLFPRL